MQGANRYHWHGLPQCLSCARFEFSHCCPTTFFSPSTPPLSPSLSASVNLSSLPSPEGNNLSHPARLSGAKSHASNRSHPWSRSTYIPPCSFRHPFVPLDMLLWLFPATLPLDQAHSYPLTRCTASNGKVYDPRRMATPLELCFTTWALGHPSHISMTLEDVSKM